MDSSFLIDLLDVPAFLLCALLWTRLLPMRCPALFVAGYLTVPFMNVVLDVTVGPEMPHNGEPIYTIIGFAGIAWIIAVQIVMPFFLYEGKAALRVFVSLLTYVATLLCEMIALGIWALLFGPSSTDGAVYYAHAMEHIPEYVFLQFVRMLVSLMIFFVLRFALRRWSSDASARAWFFVAFPGAQVLLFMLAGIESSLFEADGAYYLAMCVLGVSCVALDVLLFWVMDRSGQKHLQDERLELLQRQLDGYLERYDGVVEGIERTSHVRHDFRNQLQTVIILAEQGERERARSCMDDLLRTLE